MVIKPLDRHLFWTPVDAPGLEHLHFQADVTGFDANGLVVGVGDDGTPFRMLYRIITDSDIAVRHVDIINLLDATQRVNLRSDGQGHWTDANGAPLPALDGCMDVDLTVTPFTNTLPIRRLNFREGESHDIKVVYIY